jgi:hypothetical protein
MTVIGGSILVAVSSCLSQLKWTHYSQPTPLYTMQAIDQASRGSWGSFQLLCRPLRQTKLGPLLLLGAFVRILALAIGPFTQQILSFPNACILPIKPHGFRPQKNTYPLTSLYRTQNVNKVLKLFYLDSPMTKGITNGLMQIIKPLEPYCGSTKCDFPQFVSMGICSHCADATAQAHRSCEPTNYYFFGLSYYQNGRK